MQVMTDMSRIRRTPRASLQRSPSALQRMTFSLRSSASAGKVGNESASAHLSSRVRSWTSVALRMLAGSRASFRSNRACAGFDFMRSRPELAWSHRPDATEGLEPSVTVLGGHSIGAVYSHDLCRCNKTEERVRFPGPSRRSSVPRRLARAHSWAQISTFDPPAANREPRIEG